MANAIKDYKLKLFEHMKWSALKFLKIALRLMKKRTGDKPQP